MTPASRGRGRGPSAAESRAALEKAQKAVAGADDDLLLDDDDPTDSPPEESGDLTDKSGDRSADSPPDESSDSPAEDVGDNPPDNLADNSSDNPPDKPVDKSSDNPTDKPDDKSGDKPSDNLPDERGDESSAEQDDVVGHDMSPAVEDMAQANAQTKYPTGIDIPADLHTLVQRAPGTSRGKNAVIRQTEVFLTAFEVMYPQIERLANEHRNRHTVQSPLFGTRTAQVAEPTGPTKRLQIRPTWGQYQALQALAARHGLKLAVLSRLVLRRYFDQLRAQAAAEAAARAASTKGAAQAAKTAVAVDGKQEVAGASAGS